jgi:hypothetical protein
MFQIIIEIAQVHQYETTLQFTLMVVSILENWDIMPASAQNVTSRLPERQWSKVRTTIISDTPWKYKFSDQQGSTKLRAWQSEPHDS